jgi:hypothetical protein
MPLYGDGVNVTKTTSATAATYGSANAIPIITVDANQRISAINTTALTLTAAINANASAGDIGTYAFLQQNNSTTSYAPGSTLAGSSLFYSDSTGRLYTSSQPAGNWKCMGYDSGAALVNTGTGTGSGSGSGTISGNTGTVNVSGTISGTASGGNLSTNSGFQPQIKAASVSGTFSGSGSSSSVTGTASVNVTVNSVTVNTTVAYSATLWMRYS